jgi:hypothetical protein
LLLAFFWLNYTLSFIGSDHIVFVSHLRIRLIHKKQLNLAGLENFATLSGVVARTLQ